MIDLITIAVMILIGCGVLVGVFMWRQNKKYPVKTLVLQDRAGKGLKGIWDRSGRMADKSGRTYYKLKKMKRLLAAANFNDIIETSKGPVLILHSADPDDYVPVSINVAIDESGTAGLELIAQRDRDKARKMAYTATNREIYERFTYSSMLDKMLPIMLVIMFAVAIAIIFVAAGQGFQESTAQLIGAVNNLRGITEGLTVIQQPPY